MGKTLETAVVKAPETAVGKAPEMAVAAAKKGIKAQKTSTAVTKTGEASKGNDKDNEQGGVVYIGRIPHGFFEHEMRSYFSQFGDIKRLRLSRNRRTGASKHYAFIEFADPDVASIVAQTMDNYLLFGHLLRCSVVPPERIPPNLWAGANRRFKIVPWNRVAGRQLVEPKSESEWSAKISRESKRRAKRAARLQDKLGYVYEAPALKAAVTTDTPMLEAAEVEPVKAIEALKEAEKTEKVVEVEEVAASTEAAAPKATKATKAKKGKKSKA